jgi:hypothetical protein
MKKLFTLFCLLSYSFMNYGQTTYFSQDFLANTTITSYADIPASTNQFSEIPTVTGITNTITNGRYQIAKSGTTAVNYRFGRGVDFASEPKSLYCQFNFGVVSAPAVTKNNAIVLSLGGTGIIDGATVPTAANTYAKLNFNLIAGGLAFQLNDGTTNSANFTGNQDITFVMNNTGTTFTYVAPDGTNETLGNDLFDVWVGTSKVYNDRPVTTGTQTIKRFRFDLTHDAAVANAPTVSFDNFLMRDVTGSLNTVSAIADNLGNHTATQNVVLNGFALTNNGTGGGLAISNTGNIGVGIATPAEKLDVVGNIKTTGTLKVGAYVLPNTDGTSGQVLQTNGTGTLNWQTPSAGFTLPTLTTGSLLFSNGTTISQNNSKIFWDNTNFRLGIGTITPVQALDVTGGAKISSLAGIGSRMVITDANGILSSQAIIAGTDNLGNHIATQNLNLSTFKLTGNGGTNGLAIANDGTINANSLAGTGSRMVVTDANGNLSSQAIVQASNTDWVKLPNNKVQNTNPIMIGTFLAATAFPTQYNLYVKKGILTEEVKIAGEGSSEWADYVFAKNYKLRTLSEVEEYVKVNKHLPGVPSAEEVSKDGINVAKMEAKLLEKIEELTLYMIDIKKENIKLKNRLKRLENKK